MEESKVTSSITKKFPTAPYPPFRPLKSSLSSSSCYTTTYERAASSTSPSLVGEQIFTTGEPSIVSNTTTATNSNTHGGGTVTDHESQIKFCSGLHDDIIATINCASPSSTNYKRSNNNGPIMMELRRVCLDWNDGEFFTTRTVGSSHGLLSLGLNVTSTCLDLPSSDIVNNYNSNGDGLLLASGSSTGALCMHQFKSQEESRISSECNNDEQLFSATPIEYFHSPRHHRKASAVAWRPNIQTNHVAIGLVGTNTATSGTKNHPSLHHHRQQISMRANGSDREYCCFLWDTVDSKRTTIPLSKFSYNSPVASLAWMMNGQTLAVGGQQQTIQLYDLRMSTDDRNMLPPLSARVGYSVDGIEVHPHKPSLMATFCRSVGSVKLFDIRRMDSAVSEIRLTSKDINTSSVNRTGISSIATASIQRNQQVKVVAIQWSISESGMLSVATGESVQEYDTNSGSRPNLIRVSCVNNKAGKSIKAFALYKGKARIASHGKDCGVPIDDDSNNNNMNIIQGKRENEVTVSGSKKNRLNRLVPILYPRRMLVVLNDRSIVDMAKDTNAPLAVSHRDGRLVHTLGPHLFIGGSGEGTTAMEKVVRKKKGFAIQQQEEDISATMMRRARCVQTNPYSMNPEVNIKLISREIENEETMDQNSLSSYPKYSNRALLRLWGWIERVESLSFQEIDDAEQDVRITKDLLNLGVIQILTMNTQKYSDNNKGDEQSTISEVFGCNIYDRRAALSSCGWAGKFDLTMIMAESEALGEYERSAALAVWHEDVGAAVEALQRASESIRRVYSRRRDGDSTITSSVQYAETLDLISMCIAGFGTKSESQQGVWRRACTSLLLREDLSPTNEKYGRVAYLRALCEFLMNAGTIESLTKILENSQLGLCDRVAFACRFLKKQDLMTYLLRCVDVCQQEGDLEGLVVTSLSKPGIKILQSFVDQYTDVQTAALVVSRVILPSDWKIERNICFEWVESYRSLLNNWQFWETRAMFDVDRADLLRRVKARSGGGNYQRRISNSRIRQSPRPPDPDILPYIPAQLEARCNYCSSPLSLKSQETNTNQWLSKMQPLLNCCPQCRKPLPRCSVCLLSMGSINPYMELTSRARQNPRLASADDLSPLSSMNFAEWYTWCVRCR